MPDLTREEAHRLLAALEEKRQAAINAGDLDELDKLDRRVRGIEDALDGRSVPMPPARRVTRVTDGYYARPGKDKNVAGLLAFFLGGFGVHKFYLGKPIQGLIYLLFCWTFIPAVIALLESLVYFFSNPDDFANRYR